MQHRCTQLQRSLELQRANTEDLDEVKTEWREREEKGGKKEAMMPRAHLDFLQRHSPVVGHACRNIHVRECPLTYALFDVEVSKSTVEVLLTPSRNLHFFEL